MIASAADISGLDADPELLQQLRSFRVEQAKKRNVPAYVIFHDKTLQELASRKPETPEGLSRINGFGPRKLAEYGDAILTLIKSTD